MARRIKGIGAEALKYFPVLAVLLAIYQYYREAGGFAGFLSDIKNFNMKMLEQKWTTVAMGVAFFVGADIIAKYVPGKMRFVAKAVMYYLGASQLLSVLQGMYVYQPPPEQGQGRSLPNGGAY